MLLEEAIEKAPRTRDKSAEEREFRKVLRGQVQALKDAGVQVEIPAEIDVPVLPET